MENLRNFLKKLQNSDEAIKKRWLIGITAIVMIFVISGWLTYLNYSIEKINDVEYKIDNSTSFWQVFKTGIIIVFQSAKEKTKNLISEIMDKIKSKNTIIMEKP
ncbi:MAG TPA: hypothetical protein ENH26_00535 [Candidatus Wolfebacteria bacterium]|nr:hypothetical protein [Candidatus Wolfebacteria bacterium]